MALLAVLVAAVRIQYAPVAVLLFGLFLLRADNAARLHAVVAAALFVLAVGLFDAATWDGGLFHSYRANLAFNLTIERAGGWPGYQYLLWLLWTGSGLSALVVAVALFQWRRYGFVLAVGAAILLLHSVEPHKEYRFVFALVPLWLLVGAAIVARGADRLAARLKPAWAYGAAGLLFAAISVGGILNALPGEDEGLGANASIPIRFVRDQDPVFAAWRYLADAPGVAAVWHVDRDYHDLPGYYYLHRKVPFYDRTTGIANHLHSDLETLLASVSHLVSGDRSLAVPGYAVEREFGGIRILGREAGGPVRGWREFTPTVTHSYGEGLMRRLYPDAPLPPANFGIRFAEAG